MKKFLPYYFVLTIVITIAILAPYSTRITNSLPNAIDPVFYAWNLSHNYQSLLRGGKNLLNTNIFYPEGNTLALSDTLYAQTVLVTPILALTNNPVLAENIYILATFPLAALAMFILAYYLTGSVWASALGGIFYAFSVPRIAQIGHMPALSSQWLPLVFLYLVKYIREGGIKNIIWLFVWFLISITSTMYFGVFLIPLSGIVVISELIGKGKMVFLRSMRDFCIILIPAVVILVVALYPYIRLRAEYPGIRRSLDDSMRLSAKPTDYLTVLPTSWLSDMGLPANTNERPLYPTVTLTILAVASFVLADKKHRKTAITFFLVAIAAGLFSVGPFQGQIKMPYYYLYKIYPLLESIRVPARFSIFVILGLSVAAATTLARIMKPGKRAYAIGTLVALIFFAEIWQIRAPYVTVPTLHDIPEVYQYLNQQPDDAIIVELPLHPEWNSVPMETQLYKQYSDLTENDVYALEAYRTYFSSVHRKRMLNGYSGYFPNIYHDHSIVLDNFPTTEGITMLEKTRVRYILIHADEYVNQPYSDVARKIRNYPALVQVAQFGNDYIYRLDTTK